MSVVATGLTSVDWTFDTIVAGVADPSGLRVDGDAGVSVGGLGTMTISVDYGASHDVGDPYLLDHVVAGMTFSPAKTIADAAGTCT